jgi:hypothetical protein
MGSPADYTILVLLAVTGAGVWTLLDRLSQVQRDVEALKRKLDLDTAPPPDAS